MNIFNTKEKYVAPNSRIYPYAKLNYNLSITNCPCLIVFCESDLDIISTLKYAVNNNIPFRIRSGRHDFEAISNLNKGIVIDISKINYVKINKSNNTVTVGGGNTMGNIYSILANYGYTIPGGTCADVGSTALTSVGGIGFATRHLGLTLDNLLKVELINYESKKLTLTSYSNSDLFWAIKGGLASNFGIISSLTYKITPVKDVSVFKLSWNLGRVKELLNYWQHFGPTTDERLTTNFVYLKNSNGITVDFNGQFFGDLKTLSDLIKPFLKISIPTSFYIATIPYKEAIDLWASDCYPPNTFKNSGSFIYDTLSIEDINYLASMVEMAPPGFLHYLEFLPLGGNVLAYPEGSSSFPHRKAKFLVQIKSIWNKEYEKEKSINWTRELKHYLDKIGIGTYRGFTDFDIINWRYQYYLNNYSELKCIKNKYDPKNIFKFPQSI